MPTDLTDLRKRTQYFCAVCQSRDPTRFVRCNHPMCPDGHDQPGTFYPAATDKSNFAFGFSVGFFVGVSSVIFTVALLLLITAGARAEKGFDPNNPTAHWFETLKVPGTNNSCCGYGDAYEADVYEKHADGSYTAVVTDGSERTYPDGSIRAYVKNGTQVEVPAALVNPPKDGNPTGHAVLFLSAYESIVRQVFCFVLPPMGS